MTTTTLQSYDPSLVLADYRSTAATYYSNLGVLTDGAINTPLYSFDRLALTPTGYTCRESRQNLIRNPRGEGQVAGNPGTAPTNWTVTGATGVVYNQVGRGQENGIDYVDIQFSGVSTSAIGPAILFDSIVPAVLNTTYVFDVGTKLVAGSMAGFTLFSPEIVEMTAANATVVSTQGASFSPGTSYGRSPVVLKQVTSATTDHMEAGIGVHFTIGATISATIRFYLPEFQRGPYLVALVRPPVGSPAITTMGADDLRLSLQPGWLDAATNTFTIEAMLPQPAASGQAQGLFRLDDGTESNKFCIVNVAGGTSIHAQLTIGGTLVADVVLGSYVAGAMFRVMAGYAMVTGAGVVAGLVSGGNYASSVPTIASVPTWTRCLLGRSSLNAGRFIEEGALHANGFLNKAQVVKGVVLSESAMLYLSQMNKDMGTLLTSAGVILGT